MTDRPILRDILQPILTPVLGPRRRRGGGFSPLALFANGEQGAWYGPSDMSTLFQDAAGMTPVTATGQPVGLMLDKRMGLVRGPDVTQNGTFDGNSSAGWTLNTWVVAGNQLTKAEGDTLAATGALTEPCIAGRAYLLEFDLVLNASTLSTRLRVGAAGAQALGATFTTSGRKQTIIVATAAHDTVQFQPNGSAFNGSIDNISVRELPGNHATQPTASLRPAYNAPNIVNYDGVDDFLRTVFPNLGSNVTIGRAIPGVGASILAEQTIGAGNFDDSTDHAGLVIVDRALTGPETASLTAWLEAQANP